MGGGRKGVSEGALSEAAPSEQGYYANALCYSCGARLSCDYAMLLLPSKGVAGLNIT
ncbi:hypothetical protein [Paenibacillus terrae]|uniref:hypothetical protein n=1 Tax=Paenibacillus terrae TaxID=159743 RepID=UPI00165685EB|nr:hypothetical protein [Paenibacillus terrae]